MSVLGHGDILYAKAAQSTLKQLDAVYHCALCFITGDKHPTNTVCYMKM